MYIENLRIKSFGKLENMNIELSPGVNMIEGANESGKSTIAAFIRFIFYGVPAKERQTTVSWTTGRAEGSMTVNTGNKRYRIERTLFQTGEKSAWREDARIIDLDNNTPCHVGEVPGEVFFGVDSDLFAATAFVGQAGGAETGGAKVAESIENLLFSADENVNTQKAIAKLDAARTLLLHKNGKGGRIYELENECENLEERLKTALALSKERLTKEAQLADLRRNERTARAKSELLAKKIKQYETNALVKLFDRMHALEKKVDALEREISESGAPDAGAVSRLRTATERIALLGRELADLEARNDAAAEPIDDPVLAGYEADGGRDGVESEIRGQKMSAKVHTGVGVTLVIIGLVVLALGVIPLILGSDAARWPLIGGGIILAIAVTLFVSAGRSRAAARELEEKYDLDDLDERLTARNAARDSRRMNEFAIADARRRLEEAKKDAAGLFPETANADPERLKERLEALSESSLAAETTRAEYEKQLELLRNMREQLAGYDEEELRAAVDPTVGLDDVDRDNISAVRREADFTAKSAQSLERHAVELEKALAALPQGENSSELSDRLEAARAELETLREKLDAYLLACDKLGEASGNLRTSVSPRLASDAAKLMAHITDGKYTEIGVGGDLGMTALTDSGTRSISLLSAGTKDAAYLALRLALIGMLYRRCAPPTIFDESFARVDDERLAKLLTLAAAREQSIILTSNDRDARVMRGVGRFREIRL